MTREEAIKYWEQFDAEIDELAADNLYEEQMDALEKQREVVEFTISALRAQQTIHVTDLYDEDGCDVYRVRKDCIYPKWISVKDRLPKNEKAVLTFVGYENSMIGFMTVSSYFCYGTTPHWQWDGLMKDEQKTLFWMPLPEPPEEGTR